MPRYLLTALVALAACICLSGLTSPALAQSSPPKEQQAEMAMEFRFDQLRETPLYEMLADNIQQMQNQSGMSSEIDFENLKRMTAAVALPETVEELAAMESLGPGDDLPMSLFFQMEFVDKASADAVMEKMAADSEAIQRDGKTWYKPKEGSDSPGNFIGHRLNDTTIEGGTENYMSGKVGQNLFSAGLSSAWDSMPDAPIRMAFDLDNAREMISAAVEQAREQAPPSAGGFLDLANKASNLRLSFDLSDGGNLVTFGAKGVNEEAAEELNSGLNGILAMTKMMGAQGVEQLRQQDEATAQVLSDILNALESKQDGDQVQVVIPKPDGFEEAVQKLIRMNSMGGDF